MLMRLFKRKILIGTSIETLVVILEQFDKSNVPYKFGIKDIITQSSGDFQSNKNEKVYTNYHTIKVRKKYAQQVEDIINPYVSEQDIKQEYKLAKKVSRKLERKESFIRFLESLILLIPLKAIHFGKSEGINSVTYIASTVLFLSGIYMINKYYKELKGEENRFLRILTLLVIFVNIVTMVYAISSFLSMLR